VRQRLSRRTAPAGMAAVLALCLVIPAGAQNTRAAGRDVIKKWQDAIVNVRIALKVRMSVAGREVQATDESVDTVGTVIDGSGLTVLSLGALNPGGMMNRIMSGTSRSGQPQMELTSEPSDVKIRLPDGQELTAKIVLRDEDLDLAFLRPTTPPTRTLVAVNLADSAKPAILDEVLVLSRLGRVGGWTSSASVHDIGAIIERPRTFFVLGGSPSGMGTPAFLPNGKVVGLLTMRQIEASRTGMMGLMSGTEGLGLLSVILPAADVAEIAQQAPQK
jgi:hypothetical protein